MSFSKDELLNNVKKNIRDHGLHVTMVYATEYSPSFGYSVGLTESLNHPEIICFGLPTKLVGAIINDVVEIIKKGISINPKEEYFEIFKDSRAAFLKVDSRNIEDYFGVALEYYGDKKFEALQLVWPDRNNIFPWENEFEEEFIYKQPLLDRNAQFKFREKKNLAVYTTRQWLENKEPIVRVVHEEDGDWQFLTEEIDFEDVKVVALEQIVLRDLTINEVFDLEYGEEAERKYIGGPWIITKL